MTSTLLALVVCVAAGAPLLLLLDRRAVNDSLYALSVSFLIGGGWVSFSLLLLSIARVRWTPSLVAIFVGALPAVAAVLSLRNWVRPRQEKRPPVGIASRLIDGVTIVMLIAYARFAVVARPYDWDYFMIWGLKAKQFVDNGGVDWVFLSRPDNLFLHPNYPLLTPLLFSFDAILAGGWEDRWLGLWNVAFSLASTAVVRAMLRKETESSAVVSLGTLACAGLACSQWIGIAEGAIIAYSTAGILLIRRGLIERDDRLMLTGAVLVGLLGFTKNEGLTLAVAILASATFACRRDLRRLLPLLPAPLIASAWVSLQQIKKLPLDLTTGNPLGRAFERVSNPIAFFSTVFDSSVPFPLVWLVVFVALAAGAWYARATEPFILVAVLLQLIAVLSAYLVTPLDLEWHAKNSLDRLLLQLMVPLCFSAVVLIERAVKGRAPCSVATD